MNLNVAPYGGGMAAIWDTGSFRLRNKHIGDTWMLLEGCLKYSKFECCVGFIYCPNDRVKRVALFDTLKHIMATINKPVLLMGDFNTILHPCERVGLFRCNLSTREFAEWIQDLCLIDIPLHEIRFT